MERRQTAIYFLLAVVSVRLVCIGSTAASNAGQVKKLQILAEDSALEFYLDVVYAITHRQTYVSGSAVVKIHHQL